MLLMKCVKLGIGSGNWVEITEVFFKGVAGKCEIGLNDIGNATEPHFGCAGGKKRRHINGFLQISTKTVWLKGDQVSDVAEEVFDLDGLTSECRRRVELCSSGMWGRTSNRDSLNLLSQEIDCVQHGLLLSILGQDAMAHLNYSHKELIGVNLLRLGLRLRLGLLVCFILFHGGD